MESKKIWKVLGIVVLVIAIIWIYGFLRAICDHYNEVGLFQIAYRYDSMGPISGNGYITFFRILFYINS